MNSWWDTDIKSSCKWPVRPQRCQPKAPRARGLWLCMRLDVAHFGPPSHYCDWEMSYLFIPLQLTTLCLPLIQSGTARVQATSSLIIMADYWKGWTRTETLLYHNGLRTDRLGFSSFSKQKMGYNVKTARGTIKYDRFCWIRISVVKLSRWYVCEDS